MVVSQGIFELPRGPIFYVDDTPDAVLLHAVVSQVEQRCPVERIAVVD